MTLPILSWCTGKEFMSISWWGDVTQSNKEQKIAENKHWKPARIQLFRQIRAALEKHAIEHWIDSGTLLGAWRDKGMIPHDSDTDIAIPGQQMHQAAEQALRQELPHLGFKHASYSGKLEVYDPHSPEVPWGENGDTWHLVSCDIDLYIRREDGWQQQYFNFGIENNRIPHELIFPLGQVEFEGEVCPAPRQTEAYLTLVYGYLGEDAVFDSTSNTFVRPVV